MATQTQRPFSDFFLSDSPENAYYSETTGAGFRRLGQFFTPFAVARFMARWVLGSPICNDVLDPAVGLGVFFRALLGLVPGRSLRLTGYDLDPRVLAAAGKLFGDYSDYVFLSQQDYLLDDWDRRYGAILCNPPYRHFRRYPDRAKILADFQERLNLRVSGLTNLHTLFLLKSIHQLAPGGRAAYILPSEFLNADYGVAVKRWLVQQGSLKQVLVFDPGQTLFDNALTTSCILLFCNDGNPGDLHFLQVGSQDDLAELKFRTAGDLEFAEAGQVISPQKLDPGVKWRVYYQKQTGRIFQRLAPLSTYGEVVRGIATGDNDFFMLDERTRLQFDIDLAFLLPCLSRASHAPQHFFTPADFEQLKTWGRRVYLLDAAGAQQDERVQAYLRWGESRGAHLRYLTSHRTPWHVLEKRPPAPFLVTTFQRGSLRFVRNEAGVRNLTCFHCIYLNGIPPEQVDVLAAYLVTPLAGEVIGDNRREYGDGLTKFEPGDLKTAPVPELQALAAAAAEEIRALYLAYRAGAVSGCPEAAIVAALDGLFRRLLA